MKIYLIFIYFQKLFRLKPTELAEQKQKDPEKGVFGSQQTVSNLLKKGSKSFPNEFLLFVTGQLLSKYNFLVIKTHSVSGCKS